jgi:hypothetical protein
MLQEYPGFPPVAWRVAEYTWPTCATGSDCVVIVGAATAAATVRVAVLLVTLPIELLTATVNGLPLSEIVVTGVV